MMARFLCRVFICKSLNNINILSINLKIDNCGLLVNVVVKPSKNLRFKLTDIHTHPAIKNFISIFA